MYAAIRYGRQPSMALEMPIYLNFDMPCGTCRRAGCSWDDELFSGK